MQLRHLLAVTATVAAATAGTALVPSAAQAAPPGATNVVSYPDLPDLPAAPGAVDITSVNLYRTADAYRASVTYQALRKQNGNRWYVSFAPVLSLPGLGRGTGSTGPSDVLPTLATAGNIVELRRTPGGKMKSLSFKYTADGVTRATCSGVRATPSWAKSKIVFTIPNKCFQGGGGLLPLVQVDAGARHYAPGTFDNTVVPADTSVSGKSDSLLLPDPWFVGDSSLPTS